MKFKNQRFFSLLLVTLFFPHNSSAMEEDKEDKSVVNRQLTKKEFKEAFELFVTKTISLYDMIEELTNAVEEGKKSKDHFLDPNGVYSIKNRVYKQGFLHGGNPRGGHPAAIFIPVDPRLVQVHPLLNQSHHWSLHMSNGNYVLKNIATGEYLDARDALVKSPESGNIRSVRPQMYD